MITADGDIQQVGSGGDTAALRSALRKLSWRVLPLLGLMSTLNYLDRANLAYASREIGMCDWKCRPVVQSVPPQCCCLPVVGPSCLAVNV